MTTSKKEWVGYKFCSQSCANSVNSLGNKYRVGKPSWNKGKKTGKSPKNTRVSIVCKECGGNFDVKFHIKDKAQFCSKECKNYFQDTGKTAKNYRIRRSLEYKAWRTLVFRRDNYTCVGCKKSGCEIHADHIKQFAYYPELRFNVDNGRTLCVPCHRKTDTWGKKIVTAVTTEA